MSAVNLKKEEIAFSAKGKYRLNHQGEATTKTALQILQARHEKGDLRKAEALARISPDDLQLLKSLLARGLMSEAREVLDRTNGPSLEEWLRDEMLLQEARYSYLCGNWQEAILKCNLLEKCQNVYPLNKMTLYQIRANAYFEISEFKRSESDLQKLKSFESLFPNGQLPLYAHTNQLRLLSRLVGVEASAKEEMKLWNKWLKNLPSENFDPLLTLLRARIERLRIEKAPFAKESFASWMVSEALGDELYSGLACLDLYTATYPDSCNSELENQVLKYENSHSRIKKLKDEVFSTEIENCCETAKTIRAFIDASVSSKKINFENKSEITHLLLLELNVLIDLKNKRITRTELQPQSTEILRNLMAEKMSKEALFLEIWKLKGFSMERHDSVIRTALHRIRIQTGIDILSHQREVALPSSLMILEI